MLYYCLIISAHLEGKSVATRSLHRTILMYGFHLLVLLLCTRNVKDTQCGFKLFTRATARQLFQDLHLERWSFDIELIYVAESLSIPLVEVFIHLHLVFIIITIIIIIIIIIINFISKLLCFYFVFILFLLFIINNRLQ